MTFTRMMVVGAMASALAFTGCQDRRQSGQDVGTEGTGEQPQQVPATGGSGRTDTIPGSTDTIGGTEQGAEGVDLGGTGAEGGAVEEPGSTGGSGTMDDQGSGTLGDDGTGGSGTMDDQDSPGTLDDDDADGSGLEDDQPDTRGSDEGMR